MFDTLYSELQLNAWYDWSNNWVFVISLAWLALEAVRLLLKKAMTWNLLGDAITNFITLYAFIGLTYLFLATFYIAGFYYVYQNFSITQLPTNLWTIVACIVLADLVYYWEHRMMHRVGLGWATHTVHHSSPYFNISVAYRFGPMDGLLPFFFHLPMAMLGFNPILIFLSESLVQLYQTLLHTEVVRKLPRPDGGASSIRPLITACTMDPTSSITTGTTPVSSSSGTVCSVHSPRRRRKWSTASPTPSSR